LQTKTKTKRRSAYQQTIMRLTIAATLLTQAIPAASSSQSKNVEFAPLQSNNLIMRRLQAIKKKRRGKQVPAIEGSLLLEDPFSIESIRLSNSNKPQKVGAPLLENSKKVECNPSSQGLDVGILSCGVAGQYICQENQESLLGGFCVIEAEAPFTVRSRVLQDEDYIGIYCDKDSAEYGGYNCDCKDIDEDTKTGTIICLPYNNCCFDAGDDSFCASTTHEFYLVDGLLSGSFTSCHSFTSPYERTACVTYEVDAVTEAESCEFVIDDEMCTSCTCEDRYPLPLVDLINSDEIKDFPQTCGASSETPNGDAAPTTAPDGDAASRFHQTKSSVVVISIVAASGLFPFLMG
jgi:hypothetical protein